MGLFSEYDLKAKGMFFFIKKSVKNCKNYCDTCQFYDMLKRPIINDGHNCHLRMNAIASWLVFQPTIDQL